MTAPFDLIGMRFGRLLVLEKSSDREGGSGHTSVKWKCQCDCGNISFPITGRLRSGMSKSCGCVSREKLRTLRKKHGQYMTNTYRIWMSMNARCNNPKHLNYNNYGGRGISVCERWKEYSNFLADMGERPKGLSIDRINNDGSYEPENCRWATALEQAHNKRNPWITRRKNLATKTA